MICTNSLLGSIVNGNTICPSYIFVCSVAPNCIPSIRISAIIFFKTIIFRGLPVLTSITTFRLCLKSFIPVTLDARTYFNIGSYCWFVDWIDWPSWTTIQICQCCVIVCTICTLTFTHISIKTSFWHVQFVPREVLDCCILLLYPILAFI